MRKILIGVFVLSLVTPAFAQKLNVKIVARQDNETEYTYVVAGYSSSNSNTNVNCFGDTNVTCNGSTTTTGVSTPAHQVSFRVRGATYSLLLPDGRVAVINCESKFRERMAGPSGNRRSCRMPIVDDIEAEFNGDKAKLIWPVSLDGKKTQSETYKVLAILDKPSAATYQAAPSGNATPQDLFVWFDESAPGPGAPLFEAVVTARAYDEALAILRQARQGNTSVQTGTNVLDTGYHPATVSLDAWQKGNPKSAPSLFYWQGEEVSGATQVMHFQMTKRTYEQMMALVAGSDLRVRPSQTSNQSH